MNMIHRKTHAFDEEVIGQMIENKWMIFFSFVQITQRENATAHFVITLRTCHL
jgi:hypothetical protein